MYEENISRKRLSICPKNYNCKKWSAPITYYSNHDASFKLIISGETELNPGPSSSNRIGNQRDANVTALKCNICLRKNSKRALWENYPYITKMCYLWTKKGPVNNYIKTQVTKLQEQHTRTSKHISVQVILIHNQWHWLLTSSNSWSKIRNSTSSPYSKHGYKFSYKNEVEKRGGVVGLHMKNCYMQN